MDMYTKEQIKCIRKTMKPGEPITWEQEKMLIRLGLVSGFYDDFPDEYTGQSEGLNSLLDSILCKMSRKWIAYQRSRKLKLT